MDGLLVGPFGALILGVILGVMLGVALAGATGAAWELKESLRQSRLGRAERKAAAKRAEAERERLVREEWLLPKEEARGATGEQAVRMRKPRP